MYVLKLINIPAGSEQYYTGKTYKLDGETYADVDKLSAARAYKSYSSARTACHKINEKCVSCKFSVVAV